MELDTLFYLHLCTFTPLKIYIRTADSNFK